MTVAIAEFALQIQGTTRDETLMAADGLSIEVLDSIGGHPWIMVDDDITRNNGQGNHLADDQGYLYIAKRRYVFGGPVKDYPGIRPGHEVQKSAQDE